MTYSIVVMCVLAILLVLADEPMHGQIMHMAPAPAGRGAPGPRAVYPTIAQLEDEGLVTTQEEAVAVCDPHPEGRTKVEERAGRMGDPGPC